MLTIEDTFTILSAQGKLYWVEVWSNGYIAYADADPDTTYSFETLKELNCFLG